MQHMKDVIRTGIVEESSAGICLVRLDDAVCEGCSGRCGVGFRAPKAIVEIEGDALVGSRVEVRAPCASFGRASGVVFGLPLATLAIGMLAVATFDLPEMWTVAGLVAGLALAAGFARRSATPPATTLRRL